MFGYLFYFYLIIHVNLTLTYSTQLRKQALIAHYAKNQDFNISDLALKLSKLKTIYDDATQMTMACRLPFRRIHKKENREDMNMEVEPVGVE